MKKVLVLALISITSMGVLAEEPVSEREKAVASCSIDAMLAAYNYEFYHRNMVTMDDLQAKATTSFKREMLFEMISMPAPQYEWQIDMMRGQYQRVYHQACVKNWEGKQ